MNHKEFCGMVESVATRLLSGFSPISIRAELAPLIADHAKILALPIPIHFTHYAAHSVDDEPATLNSVTMLAHVLDAYTGKYQQIAVAEWWIDASGNPLLGEACSVIPADEIAANLQTVAQMLREYVKRYEASTALTDKAQGPRASLTDKANDDPISILAKGSQNEKIARFIVENFNGVALRPKDIYMPLCISRSTLQSAWDTKRPNNLINIGFRKDANGYYPPDCYHKK